MGLNVEQISFLIQYLGVKIPADYLRQKELEEQFKKRIAAINSKFGNYKEHHSAAKLEELLNQAGYFAGRDRNFEAALETLDEFEELVQTPPPPKEPLPELTKEHVAAKTSPEALPDDPRLDSIAKGKRRDDDLKGDGEDRKALEEIFAGLQKRCQGQLDRKDLQPKTVEVLKGALAKMRATVEGKKTSTDELALQLQEFSTLIGKAEKNEALAPKAEQMPVIEDPAPAQPQVSGRMAKILVAADADYVKRKLQEIEGPYQKAIASKSAVSAKLKAHYAAATKAADGKKWKEAIDYLGRIEGLLNAAAAEKAREAKQQSRAKRIGDTVGKVKNITFPPGAADQFSKEKLKPGKEFKRFLDALKTFEKKKTRANLEAMEKTARLYLNHVATMSDKEQRDPDRVRKKQICVTQLKMASHWKLADDFEKVGPPPWDFEKENIAGGIYAKMLFEEGDQPGKQLVGGEGGVTEAWWVEKVTDFDYDKGSDDVKKTSKKKMIFKPMDGEKEELPGFSPGMSAPREILAKVLNDQILAMTGVDTGVCPTHLVAVDNNRLAAPDGKPDPKRAAQRVGSVQQLAENNGQVGERIKETKNPDLVKKVPKQNFDQMVMLDMMTLNLDRHANNFLMKDNPDGTSNLVPIDHGYCFPTKETLKVARRRLGHPNNSLMDFPQAKEPFSPEVLQSIDMLDPDAIAATMKDATKSMEKTTPEAKGKISDESIEISRRSAMFLKRAARELTPAEMVAAHVYHQDKLLDAPPNKIGQAIEEIIAAIKKRRAEIEGSKNLISFPADAKALDDYEKSLKALGWKIEKKLIPQMFDADPGRFGRILRGRIIHPDAKKQLDARLKALNKTAPLPPGFEDMPVPDRISWLDAKLLELKKKVPAEAEKEERPADISAAAKKKLAAKYPEAELKRLAKFFTDFQAEKDDERTAQEKEEDLVNTLSWYEMFEKEGGFEEASRLGVELNYTVSAAVRDLREAKKLDEAFKVTEGVTEEAAGKQQRAYVQKLLDACQKDLAPVLLPDVKHQFAAQIQACADAAGKGNFDLAQAILEPLQRKIDAQVKNEASKIKTARDEWAKFETEYKKASDGAGLNAFRQKYAEQLKGVEPLIAAAKFDDAANMAKRLTIELERAANGANSKVVQLEKAHDEAVQLVKDISNQGTVATALRLAGEYRNGSDLGQFWNQVALLQSYAAEAATKPVRDVLETKKAANKEAYVAYSKKHKDVLEAGLSTRLQANKVNINALLASIPAMLKEVQAIT
jgi:hypothetical protein